MNTDYSNMKATITRINDASSFEFRCKSAANYHFYKHDAFAEGKVCEQRYFDIMSELFGNSINRQKVRLSQEGDMVRIIYQDPSKGWFGVLVKPLACKVTQDCSLQLCTMIQD